MPSPLNNFPPIPIPVRIANLQAEVEKLQATIRHLGTVIADARACGDVPADPDCHGSGRVGDQVVDGQPVTTDCACKSPDLKPGVWVPMDEVRVLVDAAITGEVTPGGPELSGILRRMAAAHAHYAAFAGGR